MEKSGKTYPTVPDVSLSLQNKRKVNSDSMDSRDRLTTVNPFYQSASDRQVARGQCSGQHSAPQAGSNNREALADFEAEMLRMRYAIDVAF
jgi:hypothetical protein